jgi:hypothetical protein
MAFFTVPAITFSARYCFFVISHDRRRILHFNATKNPDRDENGIVIGIIAEP